MENKERGRSDGGQYLSMFVFEDDPAKQQARLETAYSDVVNQGRGITIPDDVLNRYKDISNDPAAKLISAIKGYYNSALKGQKASVAVNGGIIEVSFRSDGRNKSVGWRMSPEKAATFEYLKPLLEYSTYAYSQRNIDDGGRHWVPRFHYFVNNANTGGVDIPVKIQIRELNLPAGTENRYYTHNFIKNMGTDSPGVPGG